MYLGFLIAYLVVMTVVGWYFSKRVKDSKSMLVANNSLPWYVNVGTLTATYVGSGALVGGAALAFNTGYNAIWLYAGGWIAIIFLSFMAKRIKKFSAVTTVEFIGARYGNKASFLAAIVVILAETAVVGYNIKSTGWVINVATGMNVNTASLIAAVVIIGFTVTAGLLSVAYTDYFQAIVIVLAMLIAVPLVLTKVGGWGAVVSAVPASYMDPIGSFNLQNMLKNALPTLCLVFMSQSYWQRFAAAKDAKEINKTNVLWFVFVVMITMIIMTFAIIGKVLLPKSTPDTIIMMIAINGVPTFLGLFLLAACASILFTSADSFLLGAVSVFENDIYTKYINKNADEKRKVFVIRIAIVVLGIIAYLQVQFFPSILSMIYYAYTMEGGLIIVVLAAFFWKRATVTGGILSVATVGIVTIVWEIIKPYGIPTIFATLTFGFVALVVGSLLTPPPDEKYLARFRQDKAEENKITV